MYIFGCEDTTTIIMDYLTREETRPLMCVNNDFNNIRNNGYHSIRVIQDFIRKNKRLKCHENKYYCRKITLTELLKNSEKYIGKTIQFIMRKIASPNKILWHCKFNGIYRYNDLQVSDRQGILAMHIGHIWQNMCVDCNRNPVITRLDSENSYTFFEREKIYEYSIRIID